MAMIKMGQWEATERIHMQPTHAAINAREIRVRMTHTKKERFGERIPEKRPKLKVLLESFSVVLLSMASLPLESLSSAAANEDARGDSSLSSPGSSTIEHRKGIRLPARSYRATLLESCLNPRYATDDQHLDSLTQGVRLVSHPGTF